MIPIILRVIISLLYAWIVSGIINYISDVLPQNRRLIAPKCISCGQEFSLNRYLSYYRCRQCQGKFPGRHWLILMASILICTFLAFTRTIWVTLLIDLLVTGYILLIIVIDIEHHLILHSTSIFGAVLMGIAGYTRHGLSPTIIGLFAGFITMFLLFLIGLYFSKFLAKKRGEEVEDGLGFGDVILGGICGLLLGWPGITVGLFTGIVLGGLYSLGLVLSHLFKKQYQPFMAIPYGPFLAGAAYLFWIFR